MRNARVFVTQEVLDSWLSEARAELGSDTLTIAGQHFRVVGAVHFLAEVTGASDPASLVGKVKTQQQLAELSAEHTGDSVLLGDNAYQVREGYTLTLLRDDSTSGEAYSRVLEVFAQP